MEDTGTKRRESGGNSSEPASAEPQSGRRKGGALKRKSNNSSSSLNNLHSAMLNSTHSSKRFMREKAAIALMQSIHNGPCTRAAAASASSAVSTVLIEPVSVNVNIEDESNVSEEWKALENAIEAEYEVVRSREAAVHVVPNHCGWFSWTKHHPLEEQALPSFFDGKAENRTPDTYMEIRNWIVKKFHSNPNKQIEIKDLEDLDVGDFDARQEVMEFLDYWGLINFHPFTQTETDSADVKTEEKESDGSNDLAEKLFKFETMQWCPPVVQKPTTPKPLTPKLLAELTIPDDSVKPEGPSVEYHCNSCSTDCSRKRYHCQKQADFDLCTECFNNGKLDSDMSLSDMSLSDFILMEPAEAPDLSSATWTDQETLLLLEALELYKENWNEIAEHVATKTKDQCILHFLQMPIEDCFLDSDLDSKEDHRDSVDIGLVAPKEGPKTTDGTHSANNEGQSQSCIEKSKQEDASEYKGCQEVNENVALKALREAFEAVGSLPEPGFESTFADAGNPVMAMAVFLARFVGSDAATASSRSSLKALSSNSPSIELATRHCFILEDPPSDMKDPVGSESTAFYVGDRGSLNDGKLMEAEDWLGDLRNCENKTNEFVKDDGIPTKSIDEDKSNATTTKERGTKKTRRPAKKSPRDNSLNGEASESFTNSAIKPSQETQKDLNLAGSGKENSGPATMDEDSVDKNRKPEDLVEKTVVEGHAEETILKKDTVETANNKEDSVEKHDKLFHVPSSIEGSKGETSSQVEPSDAVDQTDLTPKSDPEVSGSLEGDAIKTEVPNSGESKDNLSIDKVKRAAITTLAAAAVKAQLLVDHEEDEIKKLAVFLIDNQLRKLELKMSLFEDLGNVTMRVKEQLERTRHKLYQERAQIIAARLGALPSSHPKPMSSGMHLNKNAINFANSVPRPPIGMNSLRPLIGRPSMPFPQATSNQFPPSTLGSSGLRPQSQESQDNISSVRMK